jgi:hypothetical protein
MAIKNIGFYSDHKNVGGWIGWITTIKGVYFIANDGSISDCYSSCD